MCPKPDITEAQEYQESKTPTFSQSGEVSTTGRKGTILTGGGGVQSSAPTLKKTVLGA